MIQGENSSLNTNENSTDIQSTTSSKSDPSSSLNESLNILKNFNPKSLYIVNSYVDALDSYSTWRVAKILEINGEYAKLNFDGWSHKWDENIKLTGHKIAPFKKITPPYTGGNKGAIRDFDLEQSREVLVKTIEQMNSIANQGFMINDPNRITQFLRGELYILLDSILSISQPIKSSSDLKLVSDFIENFISVFVKYLEILPSTLRQFIDGKTLNQPLLHLVDETFAVASSIPEMFDSINKIFGGNQRVKLFQSNEFSLKPYTSPHAIRPREKFSASNYNLIVNSINYFASQGGFDKLISLLKWEAKITKHNQGKSDKGDKEVIYRFPLSHLKWILYIINPVTMYLSSSFKEKFAIDFKKAFFDRLEKLTNKDLKDSESTQVFGLIRDSLFIFEDFLGKEAYNLCEQAELECCLSLLKSPFLEKKIRALNEFKDFIDRADPSVDVKQLGEKRRFRYWNFEKLKQWICNKKVLEYLLGDQFHIETVKRSAGIMKFLANQNALTHEHLDLLWKSTFNAHEASIRAIYDVIIELSSEISVDNLDYLYSKIKEIPIENYDEPTINLIKEFTINAQNVVVASTPTSYFSKAIKKAPKYEFYGLKLLWDAIQDKSPLNNQFILTAFNAIATICKNTNFKSEREKYLSLCYDNVKKGTSVPQSLLLSLHILSSYQGSGLFSLGTSLDDIVAKYQKEYNLIESVVDDFEKYMKEFSIAFERLQSKNQLPENIGTHCFVGRYTHSQNIDQRLNFIENIALQPKKGDFTLDHMKKLWNVLVKRSITDVEKSAFLNWITKSKESNYGRGRTHIINDNLMKSFFQSVFCDKEQMDGFKNISYDVFRAFEKYFEVLNEKEDFIELGKNHNKVIKYESLIGHDVLWQMLLNCINEKVLKEVKNNLVNLHLKIASNNIEYRMSIWQNFISKVMDCLEIGQSTKNINIITNAISVLNLFVVNFDGRKYLQRDGPLSETLSFIVVDKKDEKSKKVIEVPINGTLFLLRKKIAEAFNLPLHDFDIYLHSNYKITPDIEEDFTVVALEQARDRHKEKDIIFNLRSGQSTSVNLREKFKNILINNQQIMDLLFELLGSNNPKIVNDIWELLSFLPTNKNLKGILERLPIDSEEAWNKILDISCTRKLLYCLQIVNELSGVSGIERSDQWNKDFLKKKGFAHLINLYFKLKEDELSTYFDAKCAAALIKLIKFFLENYSSIIKPLPEQLTKISNKVIVGLSFVTKNGFIKDLQEVENQEGFQNPTEEFIFNGFGLLETCIKILPSLVKNLYEYPELETLIKNGLVEANDVTTRLDFADGFIELVEAINQTKIPEGLPHANSFFLSFLLKNLLNYAFSHRDKCKQFFMVAEHIYMKSEDMDLAASGVDFDDLVNHLVDHLLSLTPFESQQSDQDYLLQGLLSFLELVFNKKPQMKNEIIKRKPQLLKEILHSCLFELPSALEISAKIAPPKCKSPDSRRAAFNLLQAMASGMDDTTVQITEILRYPLLKNFWRTNSNSDWHIVPLTSERSKTGYVGLKNLGCTCYMNSLMQQFFMLSDFRDTILQVEDVNADKVPKYDNLLHQLKLIFGALKLSQRQYYDPRLFCYSFKDYEGNPINVLEQMDVDEFFNNIMDKLENLIKNTKHANIIKRVFGGMLSNELICKGCPHYSEREEPFLAVSLQVKNKKNILEGLQSFIQGEMLEGDNAYLCEKCDKKVPTLKRVCIKKLPNILILVLKRFEFDFDTMQKFKVNDYCEFPTKLNMQQYTQGYLKKKEAQKKEDSQGTENSESTEPEYPPEYYEYNLRGVVIHVGTAESGHYYSLIKDSNAKWLEFNDNIVRPFDLKDLASEAYGGEERLNIGNIGNAKGIKEKARNAYLLFYERESYFDENGQHIDSMLIGERGKDLQNVENISPEILEEIKEDNYKFQMTKYIFDKDYGEFAYQLLKNCESKDFAQPEKGLLSACKYSITFFMTVILRAQDRSRLPPFLKEVKSVLKKSIDLCLWFIECFLSPNIVKEFLVSCTVRDMKYFVNGLLKIALKNTYSQYQNDSYQKFADSTLTKFINTIILVMYEEKEQIKALDKLFEVLAIFANLGDHAKTYLIQKKMVGRIVYYIFNENMPNSYKDYKLEFPTESEKPSDLGEPTLNTGVKASELVKSISEMIDKKKEKILLEQQTVNYNHLIETISILTIQCYSSESGDTTVELDQDEKSLIFQKLSVIRLLMRHAISRRARKILSQMIAILAVKREEFTKDILSLIEKELTERDDIQLKINLQTLEKLMLIHDEYQKMRLERGMNILMNTIKENASYYRATEICIDYLFTICSRNSLALRLCSENKSFLKFVETWLRENANPYSGLANQTLKLFKKKQYTVNASALQQNQNKFISKCQERIAKLKRIHKNESDELAPEYDSDEDFSDHVYQTSEKIDYLHEGNGWVTAVVIENLDEMINLKLPNDTTHWIHFDSDRTGPYLRVQSHTKNNVDFYKCQ